MNRSAGEPRTVGDFVVDLEGFEGPLDLLLELARAAKVDLRAISIVALADQYLAYLEEARARRLAIAAEYLVMAAWLACLKSQLLLPVLERPAPDGDALAATVALRLRQLEAVRVAVAWLGGRPRLGSSRFARGASPTPNRRVEPRWQASLGELLAAYAVAARRAALPEVRLPRRRRFAVDTALERMTRLLTGLDWRELRGFLPAGLELEDECRAATATTFVAGLELARRGTIDLEQNVAFGPIMIRRRTA